MWLSNDKKLTLLDKVNSKLEDEMKRNEITKVYIGSNLPVMFYCMNFANFISLQSYVYKVLYRLSLENCKITLFLFL